MQLSAQRQDDQGHEEIPAAWSQEGGAGESEMNPSVSPQEEQADALKGKVIADYKPDVDYKQGIQNGNPLRGDF